MEKTSKIVVIGRKDAPGKIKHHVEPLAKEMVSDIGVVHK